MSKTYTTRTTCRVCGSADLTPLFSLGEQFVSDFVDADKIHSGHRCPIELELCRNCTLVQAKHTAPQDFLYTRHYWYRSGVTETMRNALSDVAEAASEVVNLKPGDVVLDIGSNDGTLLRAYERCAPGVVRVGVEPAVNLATEENYEQKGLHCLRGFWSAGDYLGCEQVRLNKWRPANNPKAVTAVGMFYDLEDPNQFIADVAKVLHPEGVFIAQLMCLKQTVENGDVGNFAHEHLEFYSLKSLGHLFGKHGLEIFRTEENDVNGGSYRIYAKHAGFRAEAVRCPDPEDAANNQKMLAAEQRMGLDDPATYAAFFDRLCANRDKVVRFIRRQVELSGRLWVYGASTKGNVILQWYGLTAWNAYLDTLPNRLSAPYPLIQAAADRSPEKYGKHTIGTGIQIRSEEEFRKADPDYALVLPYTFLPEMIERERDWLRGGGEFIVPLPVPRRAWLENGSKMEAPL